MPLFSSEKWDILGKKPLFFYYVNKLLLCIYREKKTTFFFEKMKQKKSWWIPTLALTLFLPLKCGCWSTIISWGGSFCCWSMFKSKCKPEYEICKLALFMTQFRKLMAVAGCCEADRGGGGAPDLSISLIRRKRKKREAFYKIPTEKRGGGCVTFY